MGVVFIFYFDHLPFWSSSIWLSSILIIFYFGRLSFWWSFILVVFHFGRLPFWSSSILVGFSSCTLKVLPCGKIHRHTDTHTLLDKESIQPTTKTDIFIMVIISNSNINILVFRRYVSLVIIFKLSVVQYIN